MPVPPPPPPQRACPFHTLPPELLLSIISAAPFTPADFLALHLTCRRFHEVLTQHETPIAINTKRRTFSSRTIALFPGLENHDLRSVRRLWSRVRELEEVHERWVEVTTSSSSGRGDGGGEGELTWLQSRFEGIHKAGLLLLYRMHDLHLQQNHPDPTSAEPPICTHCTRTVFLPSLPATSLATILFTLISSVRILRVHGPEPVNARWGTGDVERRSDVELVCEEMILEHGVWIFLALLRGDVEGKDTTGAVDLLTTELSSLPHRQSTSHPPTLIPVLRRTLAEKCGTEVRFVMSKMWEIVAGSGFDDLQGVDEGVRMVKLVRGQEWTGREMGLRRIF